MHRPAARSRPGIWFLVQFLPPTGPAVYLARGGGYTRDKWGAHRFDTKPAARKAASAIPDRIRHPRFAPAISRTSKP